MNKDDCCKDCKDRCADPNCHTSCPKYLAYVERNNAKKEAIKKDKEKSRVTIYRSKTQP